MPYDPEHNAVTPFYGPALHFRGRYIESKPPASNAISTWWSLRVMVGCDPRLFDVKHNPKLEISAPHRVNKGWKRIDCTVDRQVGYVMWACDFAVEMRGTPADVNYSVEFANTVKRHRFHVPAFNEDPHMMYCSCNDVEKPSHRYDEAYLSWKHFNETHVEKPFGLVIAGGDQIYADKCMTGGFENDLKQLETFFLNEYLRRFADEPHMALALAQVPFIMQPDDHDYYNGAGSHGKRERGYQLPRRIAHKFRFIFQLGRSASEAFLEDRFAESSRVYRAGPNIAILSLDHRSHRDVHRKPDALMHNATWQAMRQKTQQILSCDPRYQVRHLCVLFAVPVMFLQNDIITKMSEMLNHELRSDFRDSPLSYHNRKQTRMMLDDLATIARNYSVRMTYLSGDAHVWGYGSLKTHGKHAPTYEQDPRGAMQWISSPMCNEPAVELGLMRPIGSFLAQTKRHLGPIDLKLDKLHPQRNYLRLYTERRPDGDVTLHGYFTREDALGKYIPDCEHVEAPPLRLNAKFRSGSSSGSLPGTAAAPASTALG